MRILLTFILFLAYGSISSQNLIFKSSYNDGATAEDLVMGFDGTLLGTSRSCGVVDFSRAFDGASAITYPEEVGQHLSTEFTMSFYLQVENDPAGETSVNILSARTRCDRDTAFMINYFPVNRTVSVEFWENNNPVLVSADLDENSCWHHVVVVYSVAELIIYINGIEQERTSSISRPFVIDPAATLGISTSPCIGLTEIEFEGKIDELCIFDEAMDELQVNAINLSPDKIITRDTSIFQGGSVPIETGPICTSDFTWFPTNGISSSNSVSPVITPTQTTTYELELDYGFCTSRDSVTITVIDPETVDCEQVKLPTAFTPNGDMLNDDFGISNPILVEELKSFEIYDKWGAKMFETFDKSGKWNGRFQGEIPNTNNFLYRINYNCKGQEYFKSGSFTILR